MINSTRKLQIGRPRSGILNGDLYGTTEEGGANGDGTVFEITPSGALNTLRWVFRCGGVDPGHRRELLGTTRQGGANSDRTVFKITPSGTLTTLESFDGTDGAYSEAAPAQDTNGTFYGTTDEVGTDGQGTVFSLSVGLGPFVEARPTYG